MRWLIVLTLFLVTFNIYSEDDFSDFDESKDESNSFFKFTGFVEFEQGANITGTGPMSSSEGQDWIMANRRFRLQHSSNNDRGAIFSKLDFVRDDVTNESYVDIRELRIKYTPVSWMDLSVGRQVSTWGVADMLFINDLFPKNWVANFSGRDMEAMKDSSNSIRLTSYFGGFTWDVVYHPEFSPDTTPSGCKFTTFNPNSGSRIVNLGSCGQDNPLTTTNREDGAFKHGELATALKKQIGSYNLALYGYSGFYKNPKSMMMVGSNVFPYYSRLNVWGGSAEGQLGPGIFSFETGLYDSREDKSGDDPMIENSALKYLLGYKIDLSANLSVGVQVYQEKMMDYDNYVATYSNSIIEKKTELSTTYTLRVTLKLQQETLWINLFSYIRPDDKDTFTKFDITKRFDDNFSFVTGVNIFTGDEDYNNREFGMLRDDDNLFVRVKYNL